MSVVHCSAIFTLCIGKCISRFTNSKTPYCIRFNPDEDKTNLFVVGCADKKIYTVRGQGGGRGGREGVEGEGRG